MSNKRSGPAKPIEDRSAFKDMSVDELIRLAQAGGAESLISSETSDRWRLNPWTVLVIVVFLAFFWWAVATGRLPLS